VPLQSLPPILRLVARVAPLTYSVSLLRGIWRGETWFAYAADVAILTLLFFAFTAVSAKVFRWE
jgi:uncharacterized phage infection (PIP) family protein YhgE